MSEVRDDFEEAPFTLEGTEERIETSNVEEIEVHPKLSISKKAAKKRDARRRIEDYLELKRMKEVIEDYENNNLQLNTPHWYEDGSDNNNRIEKE